MSEKERQMYIAIILAAVVISVVISYFIVSLIRSHRKLVQANRIINITEINTLEKERSRVAADLHDEISPTITAVKYLISNIEVTDQNKEFLEKAIKNLNSLLHTIRAISFDLMPTSLSERFIPTIETFIKFVASSGQIKIDFKHKNVPQLSMETVHVYRIIQEIVHNTIKHAAATELKIHLVGYENKISLFTQDNGVGFNYLEKNSQSFGSGLKSIQNRINILNGSMKIKSEKGKGTTYLFEFPVNSKLN